MSQNYHLNIISEIRVKEKDTGTSGIGVETKKYNKAGLVEEHIVVRGEKNGEVITEERVTNLEDEHMMHGLPDLNMEEYFSDLPNRTKKGLDDLLMVCEKVQSDEACMQDFEECINADIVMLG